MTDQTNSSGATPNPVDQLDDLVLRWLEEAKDHGIEPLAQWGIKRCAEQLQEVADRLRSLLASGPPPSAEILCPKCEFWKAEASEANRKLADAHCDLEELSSAPPSAGVTPPQENHDGKES